ncbi:hypothetical protein HW509_06465 [Asaia spathodeae]|uniref:hypothetical protein n=1 Tax=Asaia spathodeae TaxID=657016 RepID=UPI002FC2765E
MAADLVSKPENVWEAGHNVAANAAEGGSSAMRISPTLHQYGIAQFGMARSRRRP